MSSTLHHVAILGCGVIGLSTAVAILEDQLENPKARKTVVTIVSKEVPDIDGVTKKHSAEYASVWAGGHHVSDAKTERELRHDKITFERMSKLARDRPWAKATSPTSASTGLQILPIPPTSAGSSARKQAEPLVWVHQTELFETAGNCAARTRLPYEGVLDWYPDVSSSPYPKPPKFHSTDDWHSSLSDFLLSSRQFKPIPSSSLSQGIGLGCTFSTLDINVPLYHKWLLNRFLSLSGRLIISEATSLRSAIHLASSPSSGATVICHDTRLWASVGSKIDVLVASPGLGARFINGINDQAVHPQRGQVVLVNAPWLSASNISPPYAHKPKHDLPGYSVVRAQGGREVYIIPRGDGTVVCGGTRIVGDWDDKPRPETTRKILERCLALVPQLANPQKTSGLVRAKVEDVEVLSVNVGLRPARTGGIRLERAKKDVDGVKVIYNYGYGGAGYQASWGAALDAKKLVDEALEPPPAMSGRPAKL
ncbi:related to D-amino acid oxidase [Ustilago trichophora]|uniref:Related to D-amino acid oxidase n=1 Tax=Ustilago trichophora TaxID=86804 RepID=A0A5C3DZJ6_9BASI|nr:related to D-amino acid oxidase [Ustilago trichophora]